MSIVNNKENKIKVMDVTLSNQIAAGEVIESLMNVVKELVENSVDAKANKIEIDLINSGLKEIRVRDNGLGMNSEDAKRSILRHATSKLYSRDDLFNIGTLGFRGEAIPSIASISKMIMKTCDGSDGILLEIEANEIISQNQSDLRRGTTITVKDIYFNTPARLKYLKNLYIELSNIVNYVNKIALANPNISFSLTNDDKKLLFTDGKGDLLRVINNIYGKEVAKNSIYIEDENDDYEINGYICKPLINRSSRNFITVIVNGRSVKNNKINKSILEAYHTYLPINKFPIVVLNIETDPSIIDVNIHPTKMDIKFSKQEELDELIFNTIKGKLDKMELIPEVIQEEDNNSYETYSLNNPSVREEEASYEEVRFDFDELEVSSKEVLRMPKMRALALVHGTYIIAENEDSMYILDQHAVNERINYEYYLKKLGEDNQMQTEVLVPLKLEFTNNEYLKLKEKFDILEKLNIEFDEFGFNTIVVRKHPIWIKKEYAGQTLRNIIEVVLENEDFDQEKFNEKLSIMLSCKMAIKANMYISIEEMNELIEQLRNTSNPFTCPHGRPTVIKYNDYELEKMFKRVM